MAPNDTKVKPVFIRTRDLPFEDLTTREICSEAEKVTGYDSMEGAQRIGGLWRVYPKNHAARLQLIMAGLSMRNIHVRFHEENPFLVKSATADGDRIETTKLFISNIPISFSNKEIENKLADMNCKPASKLIDECDRDERGKLTRWKTGRRFIFIAVPSAPLPTQINIGIFTARLYHKEQTKSQPYCGNCLTNGHRKHECVAQIVCRECKKPGHKSGDELCNGREITPSTIDGDQSTVPTENEATAHTSDDGDNESSSNEGSQIREDKDKKKKKRKKKEVGSGSTDVSDEDSQKRKAPNTQSSPIPDKQELTLPHSEIESEILINGNT